MRTQPKSINWLYGALVGVLFATNLAHAQVPQLLNYQGRVVVGSTNFNGSGQFKFALVNTSGSTTYWSNDGTSTAGSQPTSSIALAVSQGLYSLQLGDTTLVNMTAIPFSVFGNSDVRLRVWFNDGTHGFQLLTPDQRISAVGYAMMANTVPDGSITSSKIAAGAVSTAQIANGAVGPTQIASGAIGNSQLASTVLNSIQNGAISVGPSGINIVCIGDSLVSGAGVPNDPRETWPAILGSLGFGLNNTIYNFGFSGYSTYSINAIYATNESIPEWIPGAITPATVSTCPGNTTASNGWAIIYGSGSDYCTVSITATESTSSKTVTGMSRTFYRVDSAGNTINLVAGDGVTGTGIPAGTVITSVGSGQITLNNYPTVNGSNLLSFVPAASNTFGTNLTALIAKAKTSGFKVAVTTITPAGNTGTPSNGSFNAQGNADCQANRLVFNTYIRGLTFNGTGSNPDLLIDLANTSAFSSFNANLFEVTGLHPNFYGNQAIASYLNSALLGTVTPNYYQYQSGQEGISAQQLPTVAATTVEANVFTADQQIGSLLNNGNSNLVVDGNITLAGSASNGSNTQTFTMQSGGTGTETINMISGLSSASLSMTAGGPFAINGPGTNGETFYCDNNGSWTLDSNTSGVAGATILSRNGYYDSIFKMSFANATQLETFDLGDTYFTIADGTSGTWLTLTESTGAVQLNALTTTGNLTLSTVGKTILLKGGSNAASGTVKLSGGVGTITSTAITANSVIFFSLVTPNGNPSTYQPLATVSAGSATVTSAPTDNSTYNWAMILVNQ